MTIPQLEPLGPYQLIRRLGGGGFTEVFLGRDTRPQNYGAPVAIKRLRPGLIHRDPVFLDSVLCEAEIGMLVQDPHVVRIAGVLDEGGEPAIVMEYIQGYRLDRLIRSTDRRGLPPEAATEIARQICEGLEAIHGVRDSEGEPLWVVHQDIKPSNLILTRQGAVKILDLGMARPQRDDRPALWVRQGTPGYRSPEQSHGERVLTPAADLYGVGVVLFELLSGKALFQHVEREPERMFERQRQTSLEMEVHASRVAPPGLDRILRKLLMFQPRERYRSAYEVIKDLAHWQWCWNSQFDLVGYLDGITPLLEALPDEGVEPGEIHRCDTEPGVRVSEPRSGEGEWAERERQMSAVMFASFDATRTAVPAQSEVRGGLSRGAEVKGRQGRGGAFQIFRRLAAPFGSR